MEKDNNVGPSLVGADLITGGRLAEDRDGRSFFTPDQNGKLPTMPEGVHYHKISNSPFGAPDSYYVSVDPGAKLPKAPIGFDWRTDGQGAWYLKKPGELPQQYL